MRVLLAVLGLLLIAAPSAGAEPRLRDAGPALAPLAVDGDAVAYTTSYRSHIVRRRGADGRHLGDIGGVPPGCTFADAGAGALLWDCEAAGGIVHDVASGQRTSLPAATTFEPLSDNARWSAIGRRWLASHITGYHYGAESYVDRLGGRVLRDPSDPRQVADLDLPGLWRDLCHPLRRTSVPDDDSGIGLELGPVAYRAPYAASLSYAGQAGPARVVLQRCAGRSRVLAPSCAYCTAPQLGDGAVAWVERRRRDSLVRVHLIAARRTLTWRLTSYLFDVALVGRRLFVVADRRLRTAVLPR